MNQFLQLGMLVMIMIQPIYPWCKSLASAQVHHEGCLEKCGNVEIPYPFGTTEGCYLNSDFLMSCEKDASVGSFQLYLGKDESMDVTKISLDGQLTLPTYIGKDCYYRNGSRNMDKFLSASLTLPYNFRVSNTQNKLFAIGCDTYARIQSAGDAETYVGTKAFTIYFMMELVRVLVAVKQPSQKIYSDMKWM
ncbi:unnamed protein product [Rhodiola kirilowii]